MAKFFTLHNAEHQNLDIKMMPPLPTKSLAAQISVSPNDGMGWMCAIFLNQSKIVTIKKTIILCCTEE